MTSSEPIGGFLELELPRFDSFPHGDALLVNSGRAAFELILRTRAPSLIHLPRYTCDAMVESLIRCDIPYRLYDISEDFEIVGSLEPGPGECLVYTNYFGLKDEECDKLAQRWGNELILDCSQALAYRRPGAAAFYSPRKFVGVPDGGCAYGAASSAGLLQVDYSATRFAHLLGRIDTGAEAAYADFQSNEIGFSGMAPRRISRLTERLLQAIDFEAVGERRRANFLHLHTLLGHANRLRLPAAAGAMPLAYPFLTDDPDLRERLAAERVYVPSFWPNVLDWSAPSSWERALATRLLPLPVDQRYGASDMERLAHLIA